ncbi:hypothetical protein [Clostridium grantii]|uniref:Uncharacterized protein n=1 Tax=Clostridium grantii DSM 8605 TaxID=1121316 RepID=A0A1M5X1G6_9CLOT|nr:hypothetical protein [Clostridium grantii]SHH93314.1 hypothetical protein SAMN02745207_03251 [Clostridium grantii DSM 8605]
MKKLIFNYMVYVIYFLGIGLVSSGIVLMPFNHIRYSIILTLGLTLFIAGSFFNEVVINKHKLSSKEIFSLLLLSLTLAIGIGMISGGISHFKESPVYASYLIPLGIVLSLLSYTYKNNYKLLKKEKIVLIVGVFMIAIVLHLILGIMGSSITGQGGDIFNSMDSMH